MRNPFVPGFGRNPYILVGSGDILEEFEDAFEPGSNSPARTTLITGQRGVGKTVLLNAFEDAAQRRQWMVIRETAGPGIVERLSRDHLPPLLEQLSVREGGPESQLKSAGVSVAGVGLNAAWEVPPAARHGLRKQIEALCAQLAQYETGLAITLDEVHDGNPDELGELGHIVQFLVRDDQPLAFAAAGLKVYMDAFLDQRGTTFLRRAERFDLGNIADLSVVADAIHKTVHDAGKTITAEVADRAAENTQGYPYLIQLVGYEAWKHSGANAAIALADVEATFSKVRRKLGANVHTSSMHGLSSIDKSYLLAMSFDDGPSRTSAVAERMGVSVGYASAYRSRLVGAGLIEDAGRGMVQFSLPYLRDYLREEDVGGAMRALNSPQTPPRA